jgi:hypothetical protein
MTAVEQSLRFFSLAGTPACATQRVFVWKNFANAQSLYVDFGLAEKQEREAQTKNLILH